MWQTKTGTIREVYLDSSSINKSTSISLVDATFQEQNKIVYLIIRL